MPGFFYIFNCLKKWKAYKVFLIYEILLSLNVQT